MDYFETVWIGSGHVSLFEVSGQPVGDETEVSEQPVWEETEVSEQPVGEETEVSGQPVGEETEFSGQQEGKETENYFILLSILTIEISLLYWSCKGHSSLEQNAGV